ERGIAARCRGAGRVLRSRADAAARRHAVRARVGARAMSVATRVRAAWTVAALRDPAAVARQLRDRGVRLEPDEVRLLTELLGRPPLWPEAVLFGILWSEHCSYKSTKHLLSRLPTDAPQVVLGPGEDAGVVALPAPCA